jgi:hypothetical protein
MVWVAWFFIMQISATGLSPLPEPPRQHFQHRLRRRDLLRHVDQLVTDHLVLRDRLAERLAFLGIGDRVLDADAGVGLCSSPPCPCVRC